MLLPSTHQLPSSRHLPILSTKLSPHQEAELHVSDNVVAHATHKGMQDISCYNQHTQKIIQLDPSAFLKIIATFRALTDILFGPSPPISWTHIYQVFLDGHWVGYLEAIHSCHPDWFAHVLWSLMFHTNLFLNDSMTWYVGCTFHNILPTI